VDGTRDYYAVTVETFRVIGVEAILEAVEVIVAAPIYQEDLTRRLSEVLQATVVTRGTHSGVETTCRAEW
jgi:GTP cyclohydrolase I